MIKGIIFDFDGVIVDTETKRFRDVNKVLSRHNYSLEERDFDKFIGKKTSFLLKEFIHDIPAKLLEKILLERTKLQYQDLKDYKLIKGVKELLAYLENHKFKIALATGSSRKIVNQLLSLHKLYDYFDVIVTSEDFDTSKPHSECYLTTLKKLRLMKDEVIIIEDSPAGIESAKSAGIKVFAITTYLKKEQLLEADNQFSNHLGILDYFKKSEN